jgi:uncharacterized protein
MHIHKHNARGERKYSYTGTVLQQSATMLCLRAVFAMPDVTTDYAVFARGDVLTEWFYTDRWYNVFRLQQGEDGPLKGWYCNITRPAQWDAHALEWHDLALDVWIAPDGALLLLDEADFKRLRLSEDERAACRAAVEQVRGLVAAREEMFAEIGGA